MRDLIVKNDDVVVATHGRGFWILDNITPLPKSILVQRAGRLTAAELAGLCGAARFAIGC